MPDYSKGCIYMIKKQDDYNNDNIYIGSCCNFSRRKCLHKSSCNNPNSIHYNFKVYQFIRVNGGWDCWCMTKIIDYPCNSKSDLNTMERHYIDEYKSKLNIQIPTRTLKEWSNDNKDKIKERQKKYELENADKIAEYKKQYYNENANKIKEYSKQYRKQYYDDNANKIKEYSKQYRKQYYLENKDQIAEKGKEKVNCDNCGCNVTKGYLAQHKKSQKCINFKPK